MKLTCKVVLMLIIIMNPFLNTSGETVRIYLADFEQWPPFRIEDKNSPYGFKGLDVDILNEISERLNIKIAIKRSPWARSLENVRTGDSDIITGVAYTRERAEYIHYVQPSYYYVNPVFYVKKGRGKLIKTYNDLYGYSIAISRGSAYFEPFNSDSKINKVELSTELQLIKMLDLGRVDVIIGTDPNILYDIQRTGTKDRFEQTIYVPDQKTRLYIGISKKSPLASRISEIEAVIQYLINEKKINQLMKKYR